MYLRHIPKIIHSYYHRYIWRIKTEEKVVFLTFDDGPTPEITDWVLDQLSQYNAKATFFLIGKNVKTHPEIVHRIIDNGHNIGNHSHTHKNGQKTNTKTYLKDFLKARKTIAEYTGFQTSLFRPPYGRITKPQANQILKTHDIIMMDVISGDFDVKLKGKDCFKYIARYTRKGSIILFHDSVKAWERLKVALPKTLEYLTENGYRFETIPNSEKTEKSINLP